MKVHFTSISNDFKVEYDTSAFFVNHYLCFNDKTYNETLMKVKTHSPNHLEIIRTGEVSQIMEFKVGEKTYSTYESNGLSLIQEIKTNKLFIDKNLIEIEFSNKINEIVVENFKIIIKIN